MDKRPRDAQKVEMRSDFSLKSHRSVLVFFFSPVWGAQKV